MPSRKVGVSPGSVGRGAGVPSGTGTGPPLAFLSRRMENSPLKSFWMAGFECSCHRLREGRRLDLTAATGHERWTAADYARVRSLGLTTVREGIAWHRCERPDGRID